MPERFELDFNRPSTAHRRAETEPMRLLLLGDFSGQAPASRPPLASRPIHRVDVDTIDTVLARLAPRVSMPDVDIDFHQLDDFHPDRLARLDVFRRARETASVAASSPSADDMERLLGTPRTETPPAPPSDIQAFIRNIVAPHIVQPPSAEAALRGQLADDAAARQMRGILHAPAFQRLETTWRGVHWLVSRLDLDDSLQLHLLDVTRDEMLEDAVASQGRLDDSALRKALTASGRQWSALIVLDSFGPAAADVGLLAALGLLSSRLGAPLFAAADETLAGTDDSPAWQALRRSEFARFIGLLAPRILLRMPYGARRDPIGVFPFEELDDEPAHDQFLWGAGSLAAALLLGRAFLARGWEMEPGDERLVDDLPAYTIVRDGEPHLQACGERYVSEPEAAAMLDAGLIPIVSHRDRPVVEVLRFQSIASPAAPIAW